MARFFTTEPSWKLIQPSIQFNILVGGGGVGVCGGVEVWEGGGGGGAVCVEI